MKLDKLGRVVFSERTQRPNRNFVPNKYQEDWLFFINRHSLASSEYLFTLDPRRSRADVTDQITALFDGLMIYKPLSQRFTEYCDGNYHVYALTDKGKKHLQKIGRYEKTITPKGYFPHQLMTASITGFYDIMCRQEGYRFIPTHEITTRLRTPVTFEWHDGFHTTDLIPDGLFGIEYSPGSFIFYFVEADRNTEAVEAKTHKRKSDLRSIRQYAQLIGKRDYRTVYGIQNAPAVLLYVTVADGHRDNVHDLVEKELKAPSWFSSNVIPQFASPFKPPKFPTQLYTMKRVGKEDWDMRQKEDPA